MIPAPGLVMAAAVMAVGVGLAMMVVSDLEPVLFWYGLPVTLLGLLLAGMWIRDRNRPLPPPPGAPDEPPAPPPGVWRPVALLALWCVGVVLFTLWTKKL